MNVQVTMVGAHNVVKTAKEVTTVYVLQGGPCKMTEEHVLTLMSADKGSTGAVMDASTLMEAIHAHVLTITS